MERRRRLVEEEWTEPGTEEFWGKGRKSSGKGDGCSICGSRWHATNECPLKDKGKSGGDGKGKGKKGSGHRKGKGKGKSKGKGKKGGGYRKGKKGKGKSRNDFADDDESWHDDSGYYDYAQTSFAGVDSCLSTPKPSLFADTPLLPTSSMSSQSQAPVVYRMDSSDEDNDTQNVTFPKVTLLEQTSYSVVGGSSSSVGPNSPTDAFYQHSREADSDDELPSSDPRSSLTRNPSPKESQRSEYLETSLRSSQS